MDEELPSDPPELRRRTGTRVAASNRQLPLYVQGGDVPHTDTLQNPYDGVNACIRRVARRVAALASSFFNLNANNGEDAEETIDPNLKIVNSMVEYTTEEINMKTAIEYIAYMVQCDAVHYQSDSMIGRVVGFRRLGVGKKQGPTGMPVNDKLQIHTTNISIAIAIMSHLEPSMVREWEAMANKQLEEEERLLTGESSQFQATAENRILDLAVKGIVSREYYPLADYEMIVETEDKCRRERSWPEWAVLIWIMLAPLTYLCSVPLLLRVLWLDHPELLHKRSAARWATLLWVLTAVLASVNASFVYLAANGHDPFLHLGIASSDGDAESRHRKAIDLFVHVENSLIFLQFVFFMLAASQTWLLLGNIHPLVVKANMMGQWGDRFACALWVEEFLSTAMIMAVISTLSTGLLYSIPRSSRHRLELIPVLYVEALGCFVSIYRIARTYGSMVLAAVRAPVGGVVGAVPGICACVRSKLENDETQTTQPHILAAMLRWQRATDQLRHLRDIVNFKVYGEEHMFAPGFLYRDCYNNEEASQVPPPLMYRAWDTHFCFPLGDKAFFRAVFELYNDGNREIDAEFFYESTLAGSHAKSLCEDICKRFLELDKRKVIHAYRSYFFSMRGRRGWAQTRVVRKHINQRIRAKSNHVFINDRQRDGSLGELLRAIRKLRQKIDSRARRPSIDVTN